MTPPDQHSPDDDAPHLLVVDDDRRIRELLRRFLGENGFRVTVAADAAEARRQLEGMAFDLLIVDVMMPGESGLSLTEHLHANSTVPVLMLTALSETGHRITGLTAGADDYLAKPFDPRELVLRINAILRRSRETVAPVSETVTFGPFIYNYLRRELKADGRLVRLTDRELDMLRFLGAHPLR